MNLITKQEQVHKIVALAEQIKKSYPTSDIYHYEHIENENGIFYKVMLFGVDDVQDLGLVVNWYSKSSLLGTCIINTRKFKIGDCINHNVFVEALNDLLIN